MLDAKFQIRMSSDLHKRLVEAAKRAHRSMNSEIVARLDASFDKMAAETIKREDLIRIVDELIDVKVEQLRERNALADKQPKKRS